MGDKRSEGGTGRARYVSGGKGERRARKRKAKMRASGGRSARRAAVESNPCNTGRKRLRIVIAGVAVAGILLGGRAAYLSFDHVGAYKVLAAEQSGGLSQDAAQRRGDILSADGTKLATTLKTNNVVATPYQIKNPKEAARKLAGVLHTNQSTKEIEDLLTKRDSKGKLSGYSVVAKNVDLNTADKVHKLGIEGVYTTPGAVRTYPNGTLASQLVGHYGDYGQAYGGVESRYNKTLAGGQDVRLTVNAAVQQQLQSSLDQTVKKFHARNAVGVVMNVNNGSIVALANEPTYNNNQFGQAPEELQRNRVITDPYEPGSTFKPFTISAALEEGAITPKSTFVVPDHMQVGGNVIHDSLPHPTETMTPAKILQKSSNIGATKVAAKLGSRNLYDYIRSFGFGGKTGIGLYGEATGDVPPYKDWNASTMGSVPYGQGLTVTPLQLAAGYATIANGGRRVTPHVVQSSSLDRSGHRVISKKTSSIVSRMLESVIQKGTGVCAQIPGYAVAGKTGTAQVVDPQTGTYSTNDYVASFIGFAPTSNPKYVTLISVSDPQGDIWGETVAAPAFQKVMKFTLEYFNVPPDRPGSKVNNDGACNVQ